MGQVGTAALIARALARTEAAHPVLRDLRRPGDAGIHLDDIAANAADSGGDAGTVAVAVEALIRALVDILVRLIGEDMAIRVIEGDEPRSALNARPQARPHGGAGEP
jgi:hypothetical protein